MVCWWRSISAVGASRLSKLIIKKLDRIWVTFGSVRAKRSLKKLLPIVDNS